MSRTPAYLAGHSIGRAPAAVLAALVLAVAAVAPVGAAGGGAATSAASPAVPAVASRHACAKPQKGAMGCHAMVRTDLKPKAARDAALSPATIAGYRPADLQSAYALASAAATSGSGVTVAIVDALDDPTAEADLAVYRAQFGLPPCTTANGCFRKVNQNGAASPLPAADAGWSQEISLDLDMVSAVCPLCSILLVEANSAFVTDLGAAVNRAAAMGARYISNSYGGAEDSSVSMADSLYFNHPGTVLTASTGDYGYGVEYPASSPYVVAVGGTTLTSAANARGWTETAWSGAGSGCSAYEPRPAWQTGTGCARKAVADVAAVADPTYGVAVVYNGAWNVFGGTSAAAPVIAAVYALAGTPTPGSNPAQYPWTRGGLNDAVGGSNGSCSPALWCTGVAGWDGPTGLGSPNGVTSFKAPVPDKPGAPGVITAGDRSVQLSWAAPASDGGLPITGYTATASPGGASCATTSTACTVTGLTNGTPYTFTVTATNAFGTSAPSDPSGAAVPHTIPGPPTITRVTGGDGQVAVEWSPPSSDGGATITSYVATTSPGGASCTTAGSPAPTGCTISGLTNGADYTVTVVAHNSSGDGPPSAPSALVEAGVLPGAPSGVSASPAAPTLGAISVAWTAADPGSDTVTGYTATASTGQACVASGTPAPTGCTITGLAPGVAVTVTVTATTLVGTGPASSALAPVTPPVGPAAAMRALPLWSLGTSVTAAWSGAPGTNPISSYDVRVRRAAWNGGFGASSTWQSGTGLGSARFGLAPGSTSCFSVRARDTQGYTSAWSAETCTASPLDDRALVRYGTWSRGTGSAFYRATYTRSSSYGSRVVRASVQAKRIAIVATTCPTCGSVRVYWGSTLLKTVSLRSATTVNRRVISIAAFSTVRTGTVTVKVATSWRRVLLDGLAISRN